MHQPVFGGMNQQIIFVTKGGRKMPEKRINIEIPANLQRAVEEYRLALGERLGVPLSRQKVIIMLLTRGLLYEEEGGK
jgi:hypothetical protein